METRMIPISKLKPAAYNPRSISTADMKKLQSSLAEFGMVEPVVVNKDYTIIGGHQRVQAAAALGWKEVPCCIVDLPKRKEKLLNLALNKISGKWDDGKLADLLDELSLPPDMADLLTPAPLSRGASKPCQEK